MKIRRNVPIAKLTTMRLGGNAKYVIEINSLEDISRAYQFARDKKLPAFIMGDGSNTIGRDDGYDGVILLNQLSGIKIIEQNDKEMIIECAAGEELDDLVEFTTKRGLTGIEALSAIPGTVGGAVFQNSGAYGQDLSQVLTQASVYDTIEEKFIEFDHNELGLSYRHTIFNNSARGRYFITAIKIQLRRGQITGDIYKSLQSYLDQNNITDRDPATIRMAVINIRADKLPDPRVIASAGSFFHNVVVNDSELENLKVKYPDIPNYDIGDSRVVSAAWLIEQCGLKGKIIHGIRINQTAPLVLINESAQNFADLAAARDEIKTAVKEKFGLELEQEPEEL